MTIDLIIPVRNEEENIALTIEWIEKNLSLDYKIIVVNDYSEDGTVKLVKQLACKYANIILADNDGKKGFAASLKKGFAIAGSDLIIPIMADLCDDIGTIYRMHAKILQGYDVVCGSRYMQGGVKNGGPPIQSFFSRLVGRSLKKLTGMPTADATNSFKCFRRRILEAIDLSGKGFEVSLELALKAYFAGFKISEVPTVWKGRYLGKSKFYLFKVAPDYLRLYLWAIGARAINRLAERR